MNRRQQSGSVFIFTLAVLAALVSVLVVVAANQRTIVRDVIQRNELERAKRAAETGLQRALAEIVASRESTTGTSSTVTKKPTLNTDSWATLGNKADEEFEVDDLTFRLQIIDTAGLLNLNAATEAQLQKLPLTTEQIESLLDFREGSRDPRPEGAKDEYYNNLTNGYNAKLANFETVDELLQVKGFTADVLYNPVQSITSNGLVPGRNGETPVLYDLLTAYSFSPEVTPTGTAKINVNAQGTNAQRLRQPPLNFNFQLSNQIAARKNWTLAELLALPGLAGANQQRTVLENLTTSGAPRIQGKINLNTADESVLSSVPELTPDIVQAILQRQSQGFETLGDVTSIPGMTGTVLQQTAARFTVYSDTFLVRVIGKAGSASVPLEAIIDVQNDRIKVISISTPPYNDMRTRWYWQTDPTATVTIVEKRS